MISRSDWQAVHDRMSEEERRNLGEPPTAEEVAAYLSGTLPAEAAARVRALLVAYPELARTLTTPFPADEAQPGDPGHFSDEQLDARWDAFRTRHLGRGGRWIRLWQGVSAVAAALAVVATLSWWQARSELTQPRVASWNGQLLAPGAMRGAADAVPLVGREGEAFVIALAVLDAPAGGDRVQILDARKNVVWESDLVPASAEHPLVVQVPAGVVTAGRYTIAYGGRDYFVRVGAR